LSLHTRRFDVRALEDVAARAMGAERQQFLENVALRDLTD
jgi:hypothetical protein